MLVACVLSAATLIQAAGTPVRLPSGGSPNARFEVALEADVDSPRYSSYEFKGPDDQFPGILVLDRQTAQSLARIPWPGDATNTSLPPMRERIKVVWRRDSAAVAINVREPHYWYSALFVLDSAGRRFIRVPLPDFAAVAGRPVPRSDLLRARGVEEAERWTDDGDLMYYIAVSPMLPLDEPVAYRAVLKVAPSGYEVLRRQPLDPDR
jgi:hypothetical protein